MDAGPGIEPGSGAYETPELPLLYPAIYLFMLKLVPRWRIELPYPPCKDGVLPLNYRGFYSILSIRTVAMNILVEDNGIEPLTYELQIRRSPS